MDPLATTRGRCSRPRLVPFVSALHLRGVTIVNVIQLPPIDAWNETEPGAVIPGDMDRVETVDEGDEAACTGLQPCTGIVAAARRRNRKSG